MDRTKKAQEHAAAVMASARQVVEDSANHTRNLGPIFRVRDKVWLNLRNTNTSQPKKKFGWINTK